MWSSGDVVFFLDAGASVKAGLADTFGLVDEFSDHVQDQVENLQVRSRKDSWYFARNWGRFLILNSNARLSTHLWPNFMIAISLGSKQYLQNHTYYT